MTRWVELAGRVLFPHFCLSCGLEDQLLCDLCKMQYALNRGVLFSVAADLETVRCFSAGRYADMVLRSLLHQYKYGRVQEAGELMTDFFLRVVSRQITAILSGLEEPIVVPVPMSPINLAQRGFNQTEIFARALAGDFELELDKKTLQRRFAWRPQAHLSEPQKRIKNVSGAFFVRSGDVSLVDREVILVDDVFTTGATIIECVRVLRSSGVKKIVIVTVLKG